MKRILQDLTPLNRAVCARGYDQAVDYLTKVLPFSVIRVPQATEHNGWVIPPSWDVADATIHRNGELVYDGTANSLGVIALSREFRGTVSLEELKRHLYYDHRDPDSIPFHYRQQFRSWDRDWGFCIPKRIYDQLQPGDYDILIRTEETHGEMKILEYTHHGTSPYTIIFGGNLDHAGVANDGLAGCVVGVEAIRRLSSRRTKFNYSLVLSPGIIGSEFYLAGLDQEIRGNILEGIFLEMLGSDTPLAVQESRNPLASVAHAMKAGLDKLAIQYRTGSFESIIVNDEYIWENYGIPMVSFSRFPYPQYHSSKDTAEMIREECLDEAVAALMEAIDLIERSPIMVKRFSGNICLSNPQYDLYMDCGQVALGDTILEERRRKRSLMDLIPSIDRPVSVAVIAQKVGLSEADTLEYLKRWADKGLVDLI